MNDEAIEKHLRGLELTELPETWRTEILSTALLEGRKTEAARRAWPPILIFLRSLLVRNPITATALAMMWILIVVLKTTTPADPAEKTMLAHFGPNRPVYVVSLREQIELVRLLENPPAPQPRQIP